MKHTALIISAILIILINYSCNKSIRTGEWTGERISFTINESGDSITKLEVVIPHGDEFLVQWFEKLEIKDNKFSYYLEGNSFLGIPKSELKGEFISNKMAKGTFNDVEWRAMPGE